MSYREDQRLLDSDSKSGRRLQRPRPESKPMPLDQKINLCGGIAIFIGIAALALAAVLGGIAIRNTNNPAPLPDPLTVNNMKVLDVLDVSMGMFVPPSWMMPVPPAPVRAAAARGKRTSMVYHVTPGDQAILLGVPGVTYDIQFPKKVQQYVNKDYYVFANATGAHTVRFTGSIDGGACSAVYQQTTFDSARQYPVALFEADKSGCFIHFKVVDCGTVMPIESRCVKYCTQDLSQCVHAERTVDDEWAETVLSNTNTCAAKAESIDEKVTYHIGADPEWSIINAPDSFINSGFTMPPDTDNAVGDSSVITVVNTGMQIYRKDTMQVLDSRAMRSSLFPECAGDTHIVWDELSKRYYFTTFGSLCVCNAYVSIPSVIGGARLCARNSLPVGTPAGACGGAGQTFPPVTTPITGDLVMAEPANGCTPLTNSVTGKIVVIERGVCSFSVKHTNAQAAGAIATVFLDTTSIAAGQKCQAIQPVGCPPSGPFTIPVITLAPKEFPLINGSLPFSNVTIGPGTLVVTTLGIGVSKTSNPQTVTTADWHVYSVPNPGETLLQDYPKISVDTDRIYISTQDYDFSGDIGNAAIQSVAAFRKDYAMDGTGVTQLWKQTFNGTTNYFMFPVENKVPYPSGSYRRQYFVGYDLLPIRESANADAVGYFNATGIRIYRTNPFSPTGNPMSSVAFPFGPGLNRIYTIFQTAPQPVSPVTGNPASRGIPAFAVPMTGIMRNNSVWFAHTYQTASADETNFIPGRPAIRWYEFDISRDIVDSIITLKQWGDVVIQDGKSGVSMPAIQVDKHGNMALLYTISGPDQAPNMAYQVRHHEDPLNTLRYPPIIMEHSKYPYDPSPIFGPGAMRWGDYAGLDLDPTDGETFYAYGMHGDDKFRVGPDAGMTITWDTALVKFKIEKSLNVPKHQTTPQHVVGSDVERELYDLFVGLFGKKKKKDNIFRREEEKEEGKFVAYGKFCETLDPMPAQCAMEKSRLGHEMYMEGEEHEVLE